MKILSIDFNYIMSSCIKLYRHFCGEDITNWDVIENELGIERFLCYDGEVLKQLAALIRRNAINGSKICTMEHHREIVDIINKRSSESEKVDITNIDWGHDIAENKEDVEQTISFDRYSNTNWVGYLQAKGKLGTYTWIKASNSIMLPEELVNKFDIRFGIGGKTHIVSLPDDFDAVCVSFSPTQVPYKYKHLFDIITMV